jgi:hypothetical protein
MTHDTVRQSRRRLFESESTPHRRNDFACTNLSRAGISSNKRDGNNDHGKLRFLVWNLGAARFAPLAYPINAPFELRPDLGVEASANAEGPIVLV